MMLPPRPERCMCGTQARVVRKAPSRCIASIFFQSAKGNSSIGCTICMPALLTSTSTPCQASTTAATAAWTCASFVTSIATASAVPPLVLISSATTCAAALLRSAIATLPPSAEKRSALSLPMPLAAPVTIQTLLRSFMKQFSGGWIGGGSDRGGALGLDQVENPHVVILGRAAGGPARVVQRLQHVRLAGGPVLAHRQARELVVLGMVLVALGAVDELHDVETDACGTQAIEDFPRIGIGAQLGRQLLHQAKGRRCRAAAHEVHIGVESRAARVADVFLAFGDIGERRRQITTRRKEVDLKDGPVAGTRLL